MTLQTVDGLVLVTDLSGLRSKFPFVTVLPQARYLEFITAAAARHPQFRLVMSARVHELIEELAH